MPELSPTYAQYLPDVYRYTFLMTGSTATAAEVLRAVVAMAARGSGAEDDRKPGQGRRWLFAKARELCRQPQNLQPPAPMPPAAGTTEEQTLPTVPVAGDAANTPNRLAALFTSLPELERSALVLFYLYLFTPQELAEVLDLKPGKLGQVLDDARARLQEDQAQLAALLAQATTVPAEATPE